MKRILSSLSAFAILFLSVGFFSSALAQTPQAIFYQAVARNAGGSLIRNQTLCAKYTMHEATPNGAVLYQETQILTTDLYGTFGANVGMGTVISGAFNSIDWAVNNKYLDIQIDFSGTCNNFVDLGTRQLITVPFALYAATADSAASGGTPQVNADWNAASGAAQILNEPAIPVFPPAGGTTFQYINGIGQSVTFPTNVSVFNNDAGYITAASAAGTYIQNGTAIQNGANFNIDGAGTIGTTLTVGSDALTNGSHTVAGLATFNDSLSETGNVNITTAASGNVVINDTPNAAAVLQIASTTQGFLPPRMTTAQRNTITAGLTTTAQMLAIQGLTIYNLDTRCIESFIDTNTPPNINWQPIGCGCSVVPDAPGTITGLPAICVPATGITYSVPAVPATNYYYNWTVPNNAIITGGIGTNTITVDFPDSASSGTISVTASSSCGTGNATTLVVKINQPSVAPASLAALPTAICNGGSTTLTQSGGVLGTGASWAWYSDPNYTTLVGTGSGSDASITVTPTTTTSYYLQAEGTASPCTANVQGPASGITVVVGGPTVSAPASVCVGSTATLSPTSGGTWVSNTVFATVTNSGVIAGVSAGSATFTFTETASGCISTTSGVTVNDLPVVTGGSTVCVGSTITLSPASGGTWASSNNNFATVTNGGVVTGVAVGNPTFTFTQTFTGCSNTTTAVSVISSATANAGSALSAICHGSTSAPLGGSVGGSATGGTWSDGGVGGTFNSGANNLNTTWTPPANYTGTATLTLTTSGGSCGTATASKTEVVSASSTGTMTFNYTGGVQHFTVSSNTCATTISVDMRGAQGGSSQHNANSTATAASIGGLGGRMQGTISVTPGQVLDIYVGGLGGNGAGTYPNTMTAGAGGYNGGGNGGAIGIHFAGGGGGGASDIRTSGGGLGNRLAVAGGGGGGGNWTANNNTDEGGPGGGTVGGAGYSASVQGGSGTSLGTPGSGGTQSAGGAAGFWMNGYGGCSQAVGGLGIGGSTCNHTDGGCGSAACQDDPGGGGGGGYYGGGAATQGGGGGGSSYPATGVTHTQGYQTGNGQITISWP
ncbi:MAG: C-terminal target protein [Bacteroidota bacterium]|nr:C-terminal target protein [Bacteroidota bacterium]